MLSKITEIALEVDAGNRNLRDSDLIVANERYNTSPDSSVGSEDQWDYKEALTGLKAAKAITLNQKELSEIATNYSYRQFVETLSANPNYGGQKILHVDFEDKKRTLSFYDVIGHEYQNRLFDAKDLILNNKTWIASAPSITDSSSPVSGYSKCTRDLEFFLEAIAYNLYSGGNNRVYDYGIMAHEALVTQANNEGRNLSDLISDYEFVFDGNSSLQGVRERLEMVIKGSADPNDDGQTLLQDTGITEASDNCINVTLAANNFIDLLLKVLENGESSLVKRSESYSNSPVGHGRLHDAAKLITDDSILNIKSWIASPPVLGEFPNKFPMSKCTRDLEFFLDAIAQDIVRGGNKMVRNYALTSRNALQTQAENDSRTYQEIIDDYELAFNGSASSEGFRYRLQQAIQGTAIINGNPIDLSDSGFGITKGSDLCSDVVSAVNTYLDMILLILRQGGQAVKESVSDYELFMIPDNRSDDTSKYQEPPYSFNQSQISKCIRDVRYYVRYVTYGLVANDTGILDELFLNALIEVNKAFDLNSNWYKKALEGLSNELSSNKSFYFSEHEVQETLPSDSNETFTITANDMLNQAIEIIDYIKNRI
jgi:hypothetical protein